MSEELFTDEDAAKTIENIQPSLAIRIRDLIRGGESVRHIVTVSRSKTRSPLILGMIEGAARYYQETRDAS